MKNIMLLVHDDAGQEARLQVALDITRALGGHLECLDVFDLPIMAADYYTGGSGAALAEMVKADERKAIAKLQARLAREDVPWTIGETLGTYPEALARASDYADLIVVSSRLGNGGESGERVRPEALPLKAHRPVMAVPPESRGLDVAGRALVAWDGSHACNEALRCAVPLLRHAERVTLLEVNNPQGAFAMTDAATYVARHGIAVDLVERNTEGAVADMVLAHAGHFGADYIVMGAYGKPRLAEAVFGGVTRTMLIESTVPLLVAH
ncbi:universal stress protein [Croceicoccus bisphenolivorans]|uniref:universal stress protein n=1 Tax=Croceicoccus bisphenolivorans TaxID=1783232 RepID=UPI000829627D|nr:universal stress protein [Croceicoccus bisphenolivorans]